VLAGLVLSACGVGWLGRVSPHGSFAFGILVPSILASVGAGICFVAIASAATSSVAGPGSGPGQRAYQQVRAVRRQHRPGGPGHRGR
jgi:hypothetical protein